MYYINENNNPINVFNKYNNKAKITNISYKK